MVSIPTAVDAARLALKKAVFLDRDGVINNAIVRDGLPYSPRRLEEFIFSEGIRENCDRLRLHGFILVVATNQPDVGRREIDRSVIDKMHELIFNTLPIDHLEVCFASGNEVEADPNRKPAPGMLLNAAKLLGIDLSSSWMVGDRWRDVSCGLAVGCRTVFIDFGYAEPLRVQPHFIVKSLSEATTTILRESRD